MTDTLIVIPARGGSVGVQCKNLQMMGGQSLIARAVTTAIRSQRGDITVSTDDGEIAEQARAVIGGGGHLYVRERPPDLATATASSEAVLRDALLDHPCPPGKEPMHHYEFVLLMQCTSPFTRPEDLLAVVARLRAGAKCVVSVTAFHGFLWSLGVEPASHALLHDPGKPRQRRQDRVAQYVENGALYGMRVADFMATGDDSGNAGSRFTTPHPDLYVMPKHRSLEIDDLWDLDCARRMDRWPSQ